MIFWISFTTSSAVLLAFTCASAIGNIWSIYVVFSCLASDTMVE